MSSTLIGRGSPMLSWTPEHPLSQVSIWELVLSTRLTDTGLEYSLTTNLNNETDRSSVFITLVPTLSIQAVSGSADQFNIIYWLTETIPEKNYQILVVVWVLIPYYWQLTRSTLWFSVQSHQEIFRIISAINRRVFLQWFLRLTAHWAQGVKEKSK